MKADLGVRRQNAAQREFDSFDFGAAGWTSGTWEADAQNALTCVACNESSEGQRTLMFRVHFLPGSCDVRDVEVAERLLVV